MLASRPGYAVAAPLNRNTKAKHSPVAAPSVSHVNMLSELAALNDHACSLADQFVPCHRTCVSSSSWWWPASTADTHVAMMLLMAAAAAQKAGATAVETWML
jgi:hypothetical protein